MNTYTITNSHTGVNFGTYDGATPEDAILSMLRDAGYGDDVVWLSADGDLEVCDEEYRDLLGDCWTARSPEIHEASTVAWAKVVGEAIKRQRSL